MLDETTSSHDLHIVPEQQDRELPPLSEINMAQIESAARAAGAIVVDYYNRRHEERPEFKSDRQVVTDADKQSQQLLKEALLSIHNCSFLGEEADEDPRVTQEALLEGDQWVVDPIDGTENMHSFPPMLGVSIGLMRDGEPVMGVIFDPIHGVMYSAKKDDDGVTITEQDGAKRIAKVSDNDVPEKAIVGLDFSSNMESRVQSMEHMAKIMERARAVKVVGAPVLSLAGVASGELDLFARPTTKLPDVIAGTALVRAAGGKVVDYDGTDWKVGAKGIVAGSPKMVDAYAPAFKPTPRDKLVQMAAERNKP